MREQHINPLSPILTQSWPTLLILFGLGLIVDLLFGTQRLLGRLPDPDAALKRFTASLRQRLDRPNRSAGERFVRGVLVLAIMLPAFGLAGLIITPYLFENGVTAALTAFTLALFLRQRRSWDTILSAGRETADMPEGTRFSVNRQSVRALVLGFADRGIANLILFCVGGFALLLPYRFLRAAIDEAAPKGLNRPEGPYLASVTPVAGLLSILAAAGSAFLLAAAHIFVPGTNLAAIQGILKRRKNALLIRMLPLNVIAFGLGLSFRLDSGRDKKSRQWIGPRTGTAKISAIHMRRAALLVLVAWILALLVASFLAGFTLTR